jgi:hypothetical protein
MASALKLPRAIMDFIIASVCWIYQQGYRSPHGY